MRYSKTLLSLVFSLSLVTVSFLTFSTQPIYSQDTKTALQRGYRTGYSDGYMAGYRDSIENATGNVSRHSEYRKADRAYAKEFGVLEDYRDGYQQGFENGYSTGFGKGNFNAALPTDLMRRGVRDTASVPSVPTETKAATTPVTANIPKATVPTEVKTTANTVPQRIETTYPQFDRDTIVVIPVDTEIIVELISDLNTISAKEGDRFQAKVISPVEIAGSIIEGRVAKIQKPGRIKRRSEMQLSFDQIRIADNRWSNMNALLAEVLPLKGDNVRQVNVEGTVTGKSSLRGDMVKVGATTGTGLVIGAIAGGPAGAAVGAAVGAGVGVGAVVVERGKHIKLTQGQQLRIKTVYETQIR